MTPRTKLLGRTVELFDLSMTLSNESRAGEPIPHAITYVDHDAGAQAAAERYGIDPAWWPGGKGWATEQVTLGTHSGTHVDAPYHYGPRDDGAVARPIDAVPLDWCIGPGVRLDCRHVEADRGITAADLKQAAEAISHMPEAGEIVLLWTGADQRLGTPDYARLYPGLREDGCRWLLARGVRVIGIDAWGLDRPMAHMAEDARRGIAPFWETHLVGRRHEYLQLEKLAHLETLPAPTGFWVLALPVKIAGASAGWARVVALRPVSEEG